MVNQAIALSCLTVAASSAIAQADWNLMEGAKVHPPYHGPVPAKSDIVFSTRSKRDDAVATAKAFGATRIEWVYTTDQEFANSLRTVTPWFGGTLNSNAPLPAGSGYSQDFDGKPIIAPWMKAWGTKWVTTTSPETQKVMAEQLQRYIKYGARSIQFDDPSLQAFSANYAGGDFNPATQAGFKAWLQSQADQTAVRSAGLSNFDGDYRAYLKSHDNVRDADDYKSRYLSFSSTPLWLAYIQSTVESYYTGVRKQLASTENGQIALSMNLANFFDPDERDRAFFLTPFADYLISETDISKTPPLVMQIANARGLGMAAVPSIKPLDLARNRVAIATLYALGAPALVPWDVYTGASTRYYGTVKEYGDIYRFAANNKALLDGQETTAVVGIAVVLDKYRKQPTRDLIQKLVDKQIPFAFVPVGGRTSRQANPQQLRHLKLLVTLNEESEFTDRELRAFDRSGVTRISSAQLSNSTLTDLQPFVAAPGGDNLKLYPRARPDRPNRLVLHIVDEARGSIEQTQNPGCSRRIGIRKSMFGNKTVRAANWMAGDSPSTAVKSEDGKGYEFFSIKGCPMWGALEIEFMR